LNILNKILFNDNYKNYIYNFTYYFGLMLLLDRPLLDQNSLFVRPLLEFVRPLD